MQHKRRGGGRRGKSTVSRARSDEEIIKELEVRVAEEAPPPGMLMQQPKQPASAVRDGDGSLTFEDLPLSPKTLQGLGSGGFHSLTGIQLAAIPHALAGRDILAAAPTGSGKTLAFLIPILECLYRSRRSPGDGLAGLVITPTRELALQIFEVLRRIGGSHHLSAGLVTGGGKAFKEEQTRLPLINVLVATPGRLLQHLEQTVGIDTSNLEVLVLDEADRLLDMGFRDQLNSILECIPSERQTLLFSATQTRSVRDLARLSLSQKNVESVSVGASLPAESNDAQERGVLAGNAPRGAAAGELTLPEKLLQNYIVCGLEEKLNVLFSFIKSHLKSKMIVFFSSCAQVRFVYDLFCALRPGTPILALHGRYKHQRRTMVYLDYVRKPSAVLFATDVAARGLDFPAVDWVVQVDASEDAEGYVHRVGRTARYKSGGRALLLLLPTEEEGVLGLLRKGNSSLAPKKLTINPKKMAHSGSITRRAAAEVAADPELRRRAEKAFTSYVQSVRLMPDQKTFNVSALPLSEFAASLGLPEAPHIANTPSEEGGEAAREAGRKKKNVNRSLQRLKEQIKADKERKRALREGANEKSDKLGEADGSESDEKGDGSSSDEEELLVPKAGRSQYELALGDEADDGAYISASKVRPRRKPVKSRITEGGISLAAVSAGSRKTVFNEGSDGDSAHTEESDDGNKANDLATSAAQRVAQICATLQAADAEDRARERQRVREKHLKKRSRDRVEAVEESHAVLASGGSSGSEDSGASSGEGESEEEHSGDEDAGRRMKRAPAMSLQEQEDAVLQALKRRK